MSARAGINSLRGEIQLSLTVLQKLEAYFVQFQQNRLSSTPGIDEAMVVAQSLSKIPAFDAYLREMAEIDE